MRDKQVNDTRLRETSKTKVTNWAVTTEKVCKGTKVPETKCRKGSCQGRSSMTKRSSSFNTWQNLSNMKRKNKVDKQSSKHREKTQQQSSIEKQVKLRSEKCASGLRRFFFFFFFFFIFFCFVSKCKQRKDTQNEPWETQRARSTSRSSKKLQREKTVTAARQKKQTEN